MTSICTPAYATLLVPKLLASKVFWSLHVDPQWLQAALNHVFEQPHRYGNVFGINHFFIIFGPIGDRVPLTSHVHYACFAYQMKS